MKSHEELKLDIQAYRHVAKKIFEAKAEIFNGEIKIPEHANVQVTEFGAFVEAVVFVPVEWIKPNA